jgi:hypothetical protein
MVSMKLIAKTASLLILIIGCLIGATFPSTAAPQSSTWAWRLMTPSGGQTPEARRNGSAVYDSRARRIIIFGGSGVSGLLNDTWAFDLAADSWTKLDTSGAAPDRRLGHNAVYDPVGNQMVVWAGQQGANFFNDTWTLNLATLEWRNVSPSSRPVARYGSASVFDPVERQLVQFAGFTEEGRRFQDTQGFDLDTNQWKDHTPQRNSPQVRCLLTAAYDRANRRMIIYGGQRSGWLDDLWAFDLRAGEWTELTPASRPAGRFFAESFVDADGRFIVFGGSTPSGNVNETWAYNFDSRRWDKIEIAEPPSPRNGMMGAYIPEENRFIVFGGTGANLLNDLWELKGPTSEVMTPEITGATISGKKLEVTGKNFDNGARILVNGQAQKTANDPQQPTLALTARKAGKRITPGQTVILQVRNADGRLSQEFSYTRPAQ